MSSLKIDRRRKEVWRLTILGKTQEEIAEQLEVSRPTIARDIKYVNDHQEEFGPSSEEAVKLLWEELLNTLTELSPWQKAKVISTILKSGVTRTVKAEESIKFEEVTPEGEDSEELLGESENKEVLPSTQKSVEDSPVQQKI